MFKNRKKLDTWEVQRYYLMMYQGLKHNRFYWELINTIRKVLLLSISAFMSTYSLNYRALSAALILLCIMRTQQYLMPYKSNMNNYLEFHEIITGAFTIFSTIIFEEDGAATINFIVFIAMMTINVRFILLWTFWMLATQRKYHSITVAMNWISFLVWYHPKLDQMDVELKEPKSKQIKPKPIKKIKIIKHKKRKHSDEFKTLIKNKKPISPKKEPKIIQKDLSLSTILEQKIRSNKESNPELENLTKSLVKVENSNSNSFAKLINYDNSKQEQSHLDINIDVVLGENHQALMDEIEEEKDIEMKKIKLMQFDIQSRDSSLGPFKLSKLKKSH